MDSLTGGSEAELIDAMDEDFAYRNEVSLSQSILNRNQDLIVKIDALNAKGDGLSEEDSVTKNIYLLELQSNMRIQRIREEVCRWRGVPGLRHTSKP